jgi:hypothetical protein
LLFFTVLFFCRLPQTLFFGGQAPQAEESSGQGAGRAGMLTGDPAAGWLIVTQGF